jgi:hypothetical protein
MSMKHGDAAIAADWAVQGWINYVWRVTRELPATHPVDERMAFALAGEELPKWLEDGIRVRLVAARGEALVAQATARASG